MNTPSPDRRRFTNNPLLPLIVYLAITGTLAVAAGGIAPDAVEADTPVWLGYGWSATMAAGGLLGGLGGVTARTRLESVGLAFILAALAIYAYAAVLTGTFSDDALAILALGACCVMRMRDLRLQRKAIETANVLVSRGYVDG